MPGRLDVEQAAKTAKRRPSAGAGPARPFRVGVAISLMSYQRVSGVNIHPGVTVAEGIGGRCFLRHAGKPTA